MTVVLDLPKAWRALLLAVCAVVTFLAVPVGGSASALDGYRADLLCSEGKEAGWTVGSVMATGKLARLDVDLGKAGLFTLLVDGDAGRMRVLSQMLKGYAETSLEGDPHNWRDILRSASSMLLPQTLGMVSLLEKSSEELGREKLAGYEAAKSLHVFTLGFMGSFRDITVLVWEHPDVAPFPLKVQIVEDSRTRSGSAWLGNICAESVEGEKFSVPQGYTRFTSVLDLILYALAAF